MSFPRRLLNDHEEVVVDVRPHWWTLAASTATWAATIVGLLVLTATEAPQWAQLGGVAVVLVALAWFVRRYAVWATTHFVVTTDRVVFRTGVLSKQGTEIPLERINTVVFSQSIFERLLRSGDLVIESAGERGTQHFSNVARPSDIQNEIYLQIEDNHARVSGGRSAPTLADQLDQLDGLRRRGILTQAEFDAKKAQLLNL